MHFDRTRRQRLLEPPSYALHFRSFTGSYPPFYTDLVDWLGFFSLDFIDMMPLSCFFKLDHDKKLIVRTASPLVLAVATGLTWSALRSSVARKRLRAETKKDLDICVKQRLLKRASAHEVVAEQLWTWIFVLFYLLFPSNSAHIFATLQCDTLDDPDKTSFLTIDYSVDCKSTFHHITSGYAIAMMAIYPFGTPLMYAYLLFVRYGRELRLLRSLELERVALLEEIRASSALAEARVGLKGRKSIWSAAILAEAQRVHVDDFSQVRSISSLEEVLLPTRVRHRVALPVSRRISGVRPADAESRGGNLQVLVLTVTSSTSTVRRSRGLFHHTIPSSICLHGRQNDRALVLRHVSVVESRAQMSH